MDLNKIKRVLNNNRKAISNKFIYNVESYEENNIVYITYNDFNKTFPLLAGNLYINLYSLFAFSRYGDIEYIDYCILTSTKNIDIDHTERTFYSTKEKKLYKGFSPTWFLPVELQDEFFRCFK